MADRPDTKTRVIAREKLAKVLGTHEMIKAWEDMTQDITVTLPDASVTNGEAVENAQATADAAVSAAATAQTTADNAASSAAAATGAAAAAQAGVNALSAVPYITVSASSDVSSERSLATDAKFATLTDGGVGSTITIASADRVAILPGDVSESAGTLTDVSGMALSLVANATYVIDGLLTFQSAATTTGIAFAVTLPAGASISGMYWHNNSGTTLQGSYNINSGTAKGLTTDVLNATENVPVSGRWVVVTSGTAGNAQLQMRTEVGGSAVTLKAGLSVMIARRIA